MKLLAALFFTSILALAQSCAPSVGFKVVTFGKMNVGIWYPTAAAPAPYSYNDSISGSVALNAPVSTCAQFPLLVFSHGYRGCGTQSVFLTEQLARQGYIVAAPDHADAGCSVASTTGGNPTVAVSFADPASWTDQSSIDRKVDMEATIDGMLASPDLGPQIDRLKIAAFGHSLGGYTIFGLIGGWDSWKDRRIDVTLLLSPYIQPFLAQTPSRVPSGSPAMFYMGGTLDIPITPAISNAGGAYDQSQSAKFFAQLRGANHLDFSNRVCGGGPTTVADCLAKARNAALIDNYAIDFFDHFLKLKKATLLFGRGMGLADYRFSR